MKTRYIFVAGGVISGVGKGVSTASMGAILKSQGFRVTILKIDPYINIDAGTMNPFEHGEVFVTEDGDETDQDIGHYERFLNQNIPRCNYLTTGRVYQAVIERERNLEYDGKCVEVVPHIPLEVIHRIKLAGQKAKADFVLIEIGGTVGEYQNLLFLEAARMMKFAESENTLFVFVSYLPVPSTIGEMKTKPTQMAIRTLNEAGIQPDLVIARAEVPLDSVRKKKISIFGNIDEKDVISSPDVASIYEVPLVLEKEGLSKRVLSKFHLKSRKVNLKDWSRLVSKIKKAKKPVRIAIVGKYFQIGNFTLADSYISVIEAIKHAAWFYNLKPEISWLNAEKYEKEPQKLNELGEFDGLLVPGGFGHRGIEGKILAIQYAREKKLPLLGLCYGLQLAVVEIARHLAGLKGAQSTEIDPKTPYPVIDLLPGQKRKIQKRKFGGTMRLGAFPCQIQKDTLAASLYQKELVFERHRHRFEVNNQFLPRLKKAGLIVAGLNPKQKLVEIIELKNHPFFLATQFHPEFKSRPLHPHPLFLGFIRACQKNE